MSIEEWLKHASGQLEKFGIGTARLDCLVLLEDATSQDRAWLLAHHKEGLTTAQLNDLSDKIMQRQKHIPLAQIRGKTEFYGRDFIINNDVLEPRPESETMIDLLKQSVESEVKNQNIRLIDIGTGSGAIAITAKLELPKAEVIATDIDPKCLKVARQNAKKHNVEITFLKGDLIEAVYKQASLSINLVLANLPYVPDNYSINEAALNEPRIAIFGGPDGLNLYRRLFKQIDTMAQKPKYILTEALPFQHKELNRIARNADYKQAEAEDFIQVFKL